MKADVDMLTSRPCVAMNCQRIGSGFQQFKSAGVDGIERIVDIEILTAIDLFPIDEQFECVIVQAPKQKCLQGRISDP